MTARYPSYAAPPSTCAGTTIQLTSSDASDMINSMKQDFVLNYIRTVDGEQDPRNLVVVFKMNVIVLQHFNLGFFLCRTMVSL